MEKILLVLIWEVEKHQMCFVNFATMKKLCDFVCHYFKAHWQTMPTKYDGIHQFVLTQGVVIVWICFNDVKYMFKIHMQT
jgi:hypothetical protein